MLYPNRNHHSPHPVNGGNGTVQASPALHTWKFPIVLERAIEELCHDHPGHMPVRMSLVEKAFSNQDEPMAVYRCPACGRRSGWVVHRHSGQSFRLWTRARVR